MPFARRSICSPRSTTPSTFTLPFSRSVPSPFSMFPPAIFSVVAPSFTFPFSTGTASAAGASSRKQTMGASVRRITLPHPTGYDTVTYMSVTTTDVIVVGAGFSGLAMGARLKRAGREDFVILERADGVGGVWRDNTYPGAACDVPSHVYSLSFAQNPDWSRTYSHQPEILDYLRRVASDEDLSSHFRFGAEVLDARYEDERLDGRHDPRHLPRPRARLRRRAARRAQAARRARPRRVRRPGLPLRPLGPRRGPRRQAGRRHRHGRERDPVHSRAPARRRPPEVFQRTAPWVLPRTERAITRLERIAFRAVPGLQNAVRRGVFWMRELGAATPLLKPMRPSVLALLGRSHLRRQVADPALRAKLTPDYTPGCKRLLMSNTYYPALGGANVDVHATGLTEVRGNTVVGADGTEREVDAIVFGTGFEVTRPPIARHMRGREGQTLDEHWGGSMTAHRGTTVHGFPNLFLLLGPNSGSGHMSVVYKAEARRGLRAGRARRARPPGAAALEPTVAAQDAWTEDVQARSQGTVWLSGGCASWYLDAEGRNTTLWPDYAHRFAAALAAFDPAEHVFEPAAVPRWRLSKTGRARGGEEEARPAYYGGEEYVSLLRCSVPLADLYVQDTVGIAVMLIAYGTAPAALPRRTGRRAALHPCGSA